MIRRIFVITLFILFLLGASLMLTEKGLTMNYYQNGKKTQIKTHKKELIEKINQLVENADEDFLLIVTPEMIRNIKQEDTCLEIEYKQYHLIKTQRPRHYKIKKMLIPLSGEYAMNEKSKGAMIFLGDKEYFSGPLGNTNADILLQEIKKYLK